MSTRYDAMIWLTTAVEDELTGEVKVIRSKEVLFVGNASLGGLFDTIRKERHTLTEENSHERRS